MDRKILDKIEVWRPAKEKRVKKRKAKVKKQIEILRSFSKLLLLPMCSLVHDETVCSVV